MRTRLTSPRFLTAGLAALLLAATACSSNASTAASVASTVATATAGGSTGSTTAPAAGSTAAPAAGSAAGSAVASTGKPASSTTASTAQAGSSSVATPASNGGVAAGASYGTSGTTSITVPSTTGEYFVLFVKPNADQALEVPVSITRGKDGTTVLTDGRAQLPEDRYRVATFQVSAPGDVDGDGIDDLTELDDPVGKNPLNPAPAMQATNGAVIVPDRATYEALSYQGEDVARDAYLAGQEFMKFWIVGANTNHPAVYFMNTNTFRAHPMFARSVGLPDGRAQGTMRGDVVWDPAAVGPDGEKGAYRFAFQPNDALPFAQVSLAFELLAANMPFAAGDLMYYPLEQAALPQYLAKDKPLYDASRVPVYVKA